MAEVMEVITNWWSEFIVGMVAVGTAIRQFFKWYQEALKDGKPFFDHIGSLFKFRKNKGEQKSVSEELEELSKNEHLTDAQQEKILSLRRSLSDKTIAELTKRAGLDHAPKDPQAEEKQAEAVFETIEKGDDEERRAMGLIAEGDVKAGLDLLSQTAEKSTQENMAQWRRIGEIAYNVHVMRAREAYEKVVHMGSQDAWDYIYLSRLYEVTGDLGKTLSVANEGLNITPTKMQHDRVALYGAIGDAYINQGDLEKALENHQASMTIIEELCATDPKNTNLQRELSVSHEKIGDVELAKGNLPSALKNYQVSMNIIEKLSTADPKNAQWQRHLSVSHVKVGDVEVAQGDLPGALKSYQASMKIREKLSTSDPKNAQWQRDLSISHEKVGNVEVAQGDLAAALKSYQASMEIKEKLSKSDPKNAQWQRDLAVSHHKIGDVEVAQKDWSGAVISYKTCLEIIQKLVKLDTQNAVWQRDVGDNLSKLAAIPDSGVPWREALEAWEEIERRGFMIAEYVGNLETARKMVAEEAAE